MSRLKSQKKNRGRTLFRIGLIGTALLVDGYSTHACAYSNGGIERHRYEQTRLDSQKDPR